MFGPIFQRATDMIKHVNDPCSVEPQDIYSLYEKSVDLHVYI